MGDFLNSESKEAIDSRVKNTVPEILLPNDQEEDLVGGEDQNVRRRMEICRQALKQRIKENGYHPVHYLR